MSRWVVGLDVGGSKVAAALGGETGVALARVRVETDLSSEAATLESIFGAVDRLLAEAGLGAGDLAGIGVAVPGEVDHRRGTVRRAVNLRWREVRLADRLRRRYAVPALCDNDANLAALGEWSFGAGREAAVLVYVSVGTGIGAGIVVDGRIHRGAGGAAGEIGHAVVLPDGPRCACGLHGCLEALASGPAIAAAARDAIAHGRDSSLRPPGTDPVAITASDVARAAAAGDPLAREVMARAAEHLAYALIFLARTLDPDRMVLGGGVAAGAGAAFLTPVRKALEGVAGFTGHALADRLAISELGEDAGLLGAVQLARTAGGRGR
ncbi:MAG TPA: ROK family protein [Dehalococcoidia bacterium]